jgi:hypothetical protein
MAFEKLGESGIGTLTKGLEATTKAAERGVIPFLLGTGVLLIFLVVAVRIRIGEHPIAELGTGEFISVLVVCGLLLLAGAAIRVWTYTCVRVFVT